MQKQKVKNKMEILYLNEHASCSYYSKSFREGFSYYKFCDMEPDIDIDIDTSKTDCILFVVDGKMEMSCDGELQKLSAGNMICLRRRCFCKIYPQGDGCIVIMKFGNVLPGCEKVSLSRLSGLNVPDDIGIYPLEIRDRLWLFLRLMIGYLEDEVYCTPFHEMKIRELFRIIQFYYTKTEQALFFRPLLGNDCKFKRDVLKNYKNAMTVKDLSRLCGVSVSSFRRIFLKEFGEPASVWLQKQINSMIELRLADGNKSIGDIAEELHFSSHPQFCRYCKKNFGHTPKEWRKLLKNRYMTPGESAPAEQC